MADRDDHTGSGHQRRRLLQAGLGAAALGSIPGAGQLAAHAQGTFDWKRFKGEKLEVFLVKSPRGDLLTKYHKEFEDMTGIAVGSEMIPEQQQRQKAVIEFNSGNTSFDVIALSYHVQKRLFGKNKWMEDVRPLMADKSLTDPNLDFADFSKAGMAWATQPDGRIDSLPFNIDPWVIYYNKELFDAKNLAYPKSFAELVDAAAKLNDPAKGICGFVARGLKNANVPVWTSFMLGYGGGFVDANGKLMTDDAGRDRRRENVPDPARQVRAARCRRLQLERGAEPVPAGQGGDVARRHRLRAAARGSNQVAHRRQGRLRRHAAGAEGASVGDVRRRRRHLGRSARRRAPRGFTWRSANKANQLRMLRRRPARRCTLGLPRGPTSPDQGAEGWIDCMLASSRSRNRACP